VAGVPAMPKLGRRVACHLTVACLLAKLSELALTAALPETIAMEVAGSIFAVSGTQCR